MTSQSTKKRYSLKALSVLEEHLGRSAAFNDTKQGGHSFSLVCQTELLLFNFHTSRGFVKHQGTDNNTSIDYGDSFEDDLLQFLENIDYKQLLITLTFERFTEHFRAVPHTLNPQLGCAYTVDELATRCYEIGTCLTQENRFMKVEITDNNVTVRFKQRNGELGEPFKATLADESMEMLTAFNAFIDGEAALWLSQTD